MSGTHSPADDVTRVEGRVAERLASLAMRDSRGEGSPPAPPYVRRYAFDHAVAAPSVDERLASLDFLAQVDAARLRGLRPGLGASSPTVACRL